MKAFISLLHFAILQSLTRICGTENTPGTKVTLYYAKKGEFNGWPRTRHEVVTAAGGTPVAGDTKILDEPFDFSEAPAGMGYWRKVDILVDSGAINAVMEGETGGKGIKNMIPFYVLGTNAEQLEFSDSIVAHDGCLVAMLGDREGNFRVLGNPDVPVQVESIEGGTGTKIGEKRGFAYSLMDNSGKHAPIYDAATHGIDLVPNP